jgi:hypothetical protein
VAHRTTLTLEEDVVDRLKREAAKTGRPFKEVVNDAIRLGLDRRQARQSGRFVIEPRKMGLRPGLDLDDIQGLLDRIEGPEHR